MLLGVRHHRYEVQRIRVGRLANGLLRQGDLQALRSQSEAVKHPPGDNTTFRESYESTRYESQHKAARVFCLLLLVNFNYTTRQLKRV
jgi:hypothetical protein